MYIYFVKVAFFRSPGLHFELKITISQNLSRTNVSVACLQILQVGKTMKGWKVAGNCRRKIF
jgi:hypothetical protein